MLEGVGSGEVPSHLSRQEGRVVVGGLWSPMPSQCVPLPLGSICDGWCGLPICVAPPGYLPDLHSAAGDTAYALWLPSRPRPRTPRAPGLPGPAELVCADCKGRHQEAWALWVPLGASLSHPGLGWGGVLGECGQNVIHTDTSYPRG